MDLSAALHIRQLGYTVRYSTLLDSSFQETAEDTLLKSDFSSKFCDFKNPTKSVFIISTSSDGRYFASGHGDHNVYISEVSSGKVIHCLSGHKRTPWTVSYHPTRNDLLASGCLAGEVRVWDVKSGCSESLKVDENTAIASVAFHPTEQYLAVATGDKILMWDWSQSYPFAVCRTASTRERLRYVRFDPTGFLLYTGITNTRDLQEPSRCIATPPEVMPLRFREMLTSRNELLQMRADLSRRHQRMIQRYNELQTRYNDLRQRYPDLAETAQHWDSNFPQSTDGIQQRATVFDDIPSTSNATSRDSFSGDSFERLFDNQPMHDESATFGRRLIDDLPLPRSNPNSIFNSSVIDAFRSGSNETAGPSRLSAQLGDSVNGSPTETLRIVDTEFDMGGMPLPIRVPSRPIMQVFNVPSSTNLLPNDEAAARFSQPPLSPIALEARISGLQDAVAYAREITTQSMEQFVRRHHDSIARLQQSYRQIHEQTQSVMQQFSQTLEDMRKLQEVVHSKYGCTLSENDDSVLSPETCACGTNRASGIALLNALNQMREVLENPMEYDNTTSLNNLADLSAEQLQRAQMENEVHRLIKVNELICNFDSTLPMNPKSKAYMNHHRIVLNDLRRDVTNVNDSQTLMFFRMRLSEEIKEFQNFVRTWKQDIMEKIRDRGGRPSGTVTKTDAQAQTSPTHLGVNDDDDQPSTSGYVGIMRSSSSSTETKMTSSSCVSKRSLLKESRRQSTSNVAVATCKTEEESLSTSDEPTSKRSKVNEEQISSQVAGSSTAANVNNPQILVTQVDEPRAQAATTESIATEDSNMSGVNDQITTAPQVRANLVDERSRVSIANAIELAMRRRQRLFGARVTERTPRPNPDVLPESTFLRVRAAAERLDYLHQRTEALTDEVSRLSRRTMDDNSLMTQMELIERREARLRMMHTPVRALRDLSADNLRFMRSSTPSDLLSLNPVYTQSVINPVDAGEGRVLNLGVSAAQAVAAQTEQQQRAVPWHRRPNPNEVTSVRAPVFLARSVLSSDAGAEPRRAYVILDRTVNAPTAPMAWEDMDSEDRLSSFDLHRSVNRAIAGAFIGTGDVAVANNILDTTCRIQCWVMKRNQPPDLSQSNTNVILGRCKLNNDGSVSISDDGRLLAAFVENDREDKTLWAHTILKVVSLRPEDRGTILYQKTFAPNAISVSISPAMGHILIGLASRRYLRLRHSPQTFAQVYRLCDSKENGKQREMKLAMNVEHRSHELTMEDMFAVRNESLNCATWLKTPGHGICYGTNKGQVVVLYGKENVVEKKDGEKDKQEVVEQQQSTQLGTMRVLLRRNGRMNLLDRGDDQTATFRTVIV